jgi:hypothetical protein
VRRRINLGWVRRRINLWWLAAFILVFAIWVCAIIVNTHADDKPPAPAAVVPAPEKEFLQWQNLRLQAENLRLQATQLDQQADAKFKEIASAIPDVDKREARMVEGRLVFVLKQDPPAQKATQK